MLKSKKYLKLIWVIGFLSTIGVTVMVDGLQRKLEAPGGFEPPVEILQTSALPLGDGAIKFVTMGMEI